MLMIFAVLLCKSSVGKTAKILNMKIMIYVTNNGQEENRVKIIKLSKIKSAKVFFDYSTLVTLSKIRELHFRLLGTNVFM